MLGLALELGGGVCSGSSPEHTREDAANIHCICRTVKDTRAISTVTKPEVFYISLETGIVQWFLCCKSIGGNNLPVLLVSTLTSSHPP